MDMALKFFFELSKNHAYVIRKGGFATGVIIGYTPEEGRVYSREKFSGKENVRLDKTIQTTLLKTIELADAKILIEV
jgi:hypothetical protein